MIAWETVIETAAGNVKRARVDDGWLVLQDYGPQTPGRLDFVPDEESG